MSYTCIYIYILYIYIICIIIIWEIINLSFATYNDIIHYTKFIIGLGSPDNNNLIYILECKVVLCYNNYYNNRLLLRQYMRRSSSVALQTQGIKLTRNRKTMRDLSMDG